MKQDYIENINRLMENCNDLSLLDLVCKIIEKSQRHTEGGTVT